MRRLQPLINWARGNGLFFALVLLIMVFAAMSKRFLTVPNFKVILQQVSVTGLIAVPGAMLVLANYVDLSVGAVSVLAAVVFGALMTVHAGLAVSIVLGLAAGVGWGVLNGYLIAVRGLSPIIVTLGGLAGARGIAEMMTQGFTTFGFGRTFALLGNGTILSVPVPVWVFALIFAVGLHIWYRTPIGRHMVAIGGARDAARSLGIRIESIPFWLYVCSGLASAVGGLIVASQLDGAAVTIGTGTELDVLTGILLGGVSFTGGRGSLFGVLFGVLFIGVLSNGLVQVNVSPYFESCAVGSALVFAAGLDIFYQRLDRIQIGGEADMPPAGAVPDAVEDEAR